MSADDGFVTVRFTRKQALALSAAEHDLGFENVKRQAALSNAFRVLDDAIDEL